MIKRTYRVYKTNRSGQDKLCKTYSTNQEAVAYVRKDMGLRDFQKCNITDIFDGVMHIGQIFSIDGKKLYEVRKEIIWKEEEVI